MLARLLLVAGCLGVAAPVAAKAWDKKCWGEVTKRAMLRKYDYKYHWGFSEHTSHGNENISAATSRSSTENSTFVSDPGITTGEISSFVQGLSSWGDCSLALHQPAELEREVYIAANFADLRRAAARGDASELEALAVMSGCEPAAFGRFAEVMRRQIDAWTVHAGGGAPFGEVIDGHLAADPGLRARCGLSARIPYG